MGCLCVVLIAAGCDAESAKTTVSGKVVYQSMAIEGARISVFENRQGGSGEVASTRSGYHGSWVLRLSPGAYRLEASASLPQADQAYLPLWGALAGVRVERGRSRLDRLLISLRPRAPSPR